MTRGKGLKAAARRYHALRIKGETTTLTAREIDKKDTLSNNMARLSMPKGWQERSDAEHQMRISNADDIKRRLNNLFSKESSG
jgi:hypothetical protein